MTQMDPITQDEHTDYRIVAITEALIEHSDLWATRKDDSIEIDCTLAAIIAVASLEETLDNEFGGRICRHACHKAQQEDDIAAINAYVSESPEARDIAEQMVLMIMDEGAA